MDRHTLKNNREEESDGVAYLPYEHEFDEESKTGGGKDSEVEEEDGKFGEVLYQDVAEGRKVEGLLFGLAGVVKKGGEVLDGMGGGELNFLNEGIFAIGTAQKCFSKP